MDTSNVNHPLTTSTPFGQAPTQAPTFEQQFVNSVRSELPEIKIKTPKSSRAIIIFAISIFMCVGLAIAGVILLFAPRETNLVAEKSSEEINLREKESQILSETGFTAEYYAALRDTSSVVEQRYAEEDAANTESQSGVDFIKSGAIYFFIAAGIVMIVGISLFIKL